MTSPELGQARYAQGSQILEAVDGESGQRVIDALGDVAPALGHHVVAFGSATSTRVPGSPPRNANS